MSQPTQEQTETIVAELIKSYWKEVETVQNYLAVATNLVGVGAQEVKESLEGDVDEEFGHARRLAKRIHVLGGRVPGSMEFQPEQDAMQPPRDNRDMLSVIRGVIAAEEDAIQQYGRIIEMCDGVDYVTQDLCIGLLADEQSHRREFLEFLAEYDQGE